MHEIRLCSCLFPILNLNQLNAFFLPSSSNQEKYQYKKKRITAVHFLTDRHVSVIIGFLLS